MLGPVEKKHLSKDDVHETLEVSDSRNGLFSSDLLISHLDSSML